jgi:hypothetical protein
VTGVWGGVRRSARRQVTTRTRQWREWVMADKTASSCCGVVRLSMQFIVLGKDLNELRRIDMVGHEIGEGVCMHLARLRFWCHSVINLASANNPHTVP